MGKQILQHRFLLLLVIASIQVAAQNDNSKPNFAVYNNYDFIPGDKILFEDAFTDGQDGEFPSHWELRSGQAVVNKLKDEPAFFLTDGNYVVVNPRMKTEKYLTNSFTIEYDLYPVKKEDATSYGLITFFHSVDADGSEKESSVYVTPGEVKFDGNEVSLIKELPADVADEKFFNTWHHVAIAFKDRQLKVYLDQFRALVVPDTKGTYQSVSFGGIGDNNAPIVFKDVKIASGGGMNMIGKTFTDTKIVTHGINFDVDKASIRPESMGTLNMIVQILKDNPAIKFEIDGHTDNAGTAAHNLSLSQQRAAAVKDQLVKMGVDAARLTTKGFGDTKPIADNATLEGKANNRRVEFVKM